MNLDELSQFITDMQAIVSERDELKAKLADALNSLEMTRSSAAAGIARLQDVASKMRPDPATATKAQNIMTTALLLLNRQPKIPYKFGGNSLAGFDCSEFVQTVYDFNGIELPRVSNDQAKKA